MLEKFVKWWNKTFRGWKYRTLGECEDEYKRLSKKEIIKRIVLVTGQLNGNPGVIDRKFDKELRDMGRKLLVKALLLLQVAYTKKLRG